MNDPFSTRRSTDPIKQSFDALVKDLENCSRLLPMIA